MKSDTINSIDRALDMLMLLYYEEKELGVTEIASHMGLYKSTVHRTLCTLENKGFVKQNEENGRYWLGMELYALGMIVGETMSIREIVKPYAKGLSDKFNEVVNVSVLDMNYGKYPRTILIYKEEKKNQRLKVSQKLGSSSEIHYSAVGKSILAFSEPEIYERLKGIEFHTYTKNTIKNWDDLCKELDKVRELGYSVDNEEFEVGLKCVAAPIFGKNNKPIAAISISGPISRINESGNFKNIVEEVKNTAKKISCILK